MFENGLRDPLGPGASVPAPPGRPHEFGRLISQTIVSENETYYHHYDALGSTAVLTDGDEVVTDEYAYEAFGATAAESGPTPNPHLWVAETGYRKDEETGLYDLRRRKYSPQTGRFASEDPLRDDEENLYRYVGNRPVRKADPSGLDFVVDAEDVFWISSNTNLPGWGPDILGRSEYIGKRAGSLVLISDKWGGGWVVYRELEAMANRTVSITITQTHDLDHIVKTRLDQLRLNDDIVDALIRVVGTSGIVDGLSVRRAEQIEGAISARELHSRHSTAYVSIPFDTKNGIRLRAVYRFVSSGWIAPGFYYELVLITNEENGTDESLRQMIDVEMEAFGEASLRSVPVYGNFRTIFSKDASASERHLSLSLLAFDALGALESMVAKGSRIGAGARSGTSLGHVAPAANRAPQAARTSVGQFPSTATARATSTTGTETTATRVGEIARIDEIGDLLQRLPPTRAFESGPGTTRLALSDDALKGNAFGTLSPETRRLLNILEESDSVFAAPARTVDLFQSLRGRSLSNLTRQQVGDIGEDVAQRLLGENGFTDIISVQNRSGNGIDIVARASDGRLVFFEVKSSRVGQVGNLSTRQQSMTSFVEDVLGQAATGTGRYRHLDAAAQDTARRLLREFRRDPLNVSGNAVGVDLLNEMIRISPWR